jgi:hypothetical protein
MAVESFVDQPIIVAILFEGVLHEQQLGLQAVFNIESSDPVHPSRQYSLFIGWVMMELSVEVEISVCVGGEGVAVQFVYQRAIRSPVSKSRKGRWPSLSVSMMNCMDW